MAKNELYMLYPQLGSNEFCTTAGVRKIPDPIPHTFSSLEEYRDCFKEFIIYEQQSEKKNNQ